MGARYRVRALLLTIAALSLFTMGCTDLVESGMHLLGFEPRTEADETKDLMEREAQINPGSEIGSHPAPEGTDEVVAFDVTGEGLAYHMGLLKNTVYYIDYDTGRVTANESEPFTEPAGDVQTRTGTDSVTFDGTYDASAKTISGTLTVKTEGVSSGGGASDISMRYTMTGQLEASLEGDTWSGTVTGQSMLWQQIELPDTAPEETPGTANWTITSVSREVL